MTRREELAQARERDRATADCVECGGMENGYHHLSAPRRHTSHQPRRRPRPAGPAEVIAIGHGVATAIRDGVLHAVFGPLWAQIERERADGPRYVEAVREGRRLRERTVYSSAAMYVDHCEWGAWETERGLGLPVGWLTR